MNDKNLPTSDQEGQEVRQRRTRRMVKEGNHTLSEGLSSIEKSPIDHYGSCARLKANDLKYYRSCAQNKADNARDYGSCAQFQAEDNACPTHQQKDHSEMIIMRNSETHQVKGVREEYSSKLQPSYTCEINSKHNWPREPRNALATSQSESAMKPSSMQANSKVNSNEGAKDENSKAHGCTWAE